MKFISYFTLVVVAGVLLFFIVGVSTMHHPRADAVSAITPTETDMVDRFNPECRNTPIGQMTRAKLKECDAIEGFLQGTKELFYKAQAEKERPARALSEQECLDALPGRAHMPGCVYTFHGSKVSATVVAPR